MYIFIFKKILDSLTAQPASTVVECCKIQLHWTYYCSGDSWQINSYLPETSREITPSLLEMIETVSVTYFLSPDTVSVTYFLYPDTVYVNNLFLKGNSKVCLFNMLCWVKVKKLNRIGGCFAKKQLIFTKQHSNNWYWTIHWT